MSANEMNEGLCVEVEEAMASILDGTASQRLFDHVADCDRCRDAKHDATTASEHVANAGADFRAPEGFADRLLAKIEAERPNGPRSSVASPRESREVPSTRSDEARSSSDPIAREEKTLADALERFDGEPPIKDLKTQLSPPPVFEDTSEAPAQPPKTEAPRSSDAAPARATPAAATKTDPSPKSAATSPKIEAARSPRALVATRRPWMIGGAVAATLAVAAGVALYMKHRSAEQRTAEVEGPWSGKVEDVARASSDKSGGFEACNLKGECSAALAEGEIKAGWTLKTDARTRARVRLADDSVVAIDRGSELVLDKSSARSARLVKGMIVADVAHIDGKSAHFGVGGADVEVVGTKLALTASDDRASVEVARGEVKVTTDAGKSVSVRAGEEATLLKGGDPIVASSSSLADTMEWSDKSEEDVDSPALRGIGELRARKPGDTKEKDHAVRLAKHSAKIRIVDLVARTEIDETFTNDTDEELEGIYRFPLPPGAQIEKMSLEVDGKLVDGAFVDRDRGAAIWRGVIQHAAPQAPKPKDEIVWVPGPWRDPALLEWQRGGRFELKIFPIPKRGSRRVVLTYTQTVDESGGLRRFSYPLAHDATGTTKIGSFDLDLQILGADKGVPITTRGYDLTSASSNGDAERRTMHADDFIPAGDLTVEYALPNRDSEVQAWGYVPSPPPPPSGPITGPFVPPDTSPYVAIALRPNLPHWREEKERVHAIVVDASRSMVGERFARATHLASAIVREMDRRDSFVLLACDTVCKPMTNDAGGLARPEAPGAAAAGDVEKFLGTIEPDGGSDLAAQIAAARAAIGGTNAKDLRIMYLGDGTPSVGATKPAQIEIAARRAAGDATVIAVPLGSDADSTSLQAMARGGGGVVVPYVPGERVASAALDVLGAAYGTELRDAEVELPSCLGQANVCLTDVAPARLDPIRAGSETLVFARMSGGGATLDGEIKLRGKIAGEPFERSYPLHVVATASAGNAFVPRLFAAAKIADLERNGGEAAKPTIVDLSKRFAVASRFTSLLVLESEAMFKAFGVDRSGGGSTFTGEDAATSDSSVVTKIQAQDQDVDGFADTANPYGGERRAGGAHASRGVAPAKKAEGFFGDDKRKEDQAADEEKAPMSPPADMAAPLGGVTSTPSPAATMAPPAQAAAPPPPPQPSEAPQAKVAGGAANGPSTNDMNGVARHRWLPPRRPQRLIPMRKVFDRKARFDAVNTLAQGSTAKLAAAESALATAPDSRDKTIDLFALYSVSGRVGEAQELTSRWSGRDALDPDALQARSDLAARQGDRDRAIRILGGLADVRPNDRTIQARLADLHDAAGDRALACEYRVSLADLALSEAKLVADAVRCSREQGNIELASQIEADAGDKLRPVVDSFLARPVTTSPSTLRGDVQVAATWSGNADLDVALIDASGKRTSWMGSATRGTVTSIDPKSTHDESLAIANLPQGSYVVEIARASGGNDASDTIRGDVTIKLPDGASQRVPFTLTGARVEIGTVKVFFTSHLVPVNAWDASPQPF